MILDFSQHYFLLEQRTVVFGMQCFNTFKVVEYIYSIQRQTLQILFLKLQMLCLTYWVVSFGTFDKIHQRIMRLFCNYKAKKIIEWKTKIIPSLSSISSSSYRNAQGKCKTFL